MTTPEKKQRRVLLHTTLLLAVTVALLAMTVTERCAAQSTEDWEQRVRAEVTSHHINTALTVVDQRLKDAPNDLEAHGWRGRLLAWKGRWSEGEAEYELVLKSFPNDTEILTGLADVLLWQKKYAEALQTLDHARSIAPTDPEILTRRARILALLNRASEARSEYQEALKFDPSSPDAKAGLASLRASAKHEFRIGNATDLFSYTNAAETQEISLSSRWSRHWSTVFGATIYQRFGEDAGKFVASSAYHFNDHDSLNVGGAMANQQDVAPTSEAFFEYGHGFRFDNRLVPGLESSYQQHWYWYRGAQVLTLSGTNLVYFPREWTWGITVIGARTAFTGTPADWVPSGWTKLGFPLRHTLTGNVFYAVGSENFAEVDQIGRLAAHTYGGGLRYQFAEKQDVTGYISREDRTHNQTDTSFGLSYGIRF